MLSVADVEQLPRNMTQIEKIVEKIRQKKYVFSKHALDQSIIRGIGVPEMEHAIIKKAVIIEDYPDDKYGPSCLILGYTKSGRALHIQCGCSENLLMKIITLYQPDQKFWVDDKIRK